MSAPEPSPAPAELDGEVVGGREAVHAGADDDVAGRSGYHVNCLPGNGVSKSERRVPWPAPANQPSATSPPSSARSRCSTRSPTAASSGRTRSRAAPASTRARSRVCSRRSPRRGSSSTCRRPGATGSRCASSSSATPCSAGSTCVRSRGRISQALVRETGETATLSAPGEHDAVTVDFVHSSSVVQSVAQLGRPSVGHATAAGKVHARLRRRGAAGRPARRVHAAHDHDARSGSSRSSGACGGAASPRRGRSARRISRRRRAGARQSRRARRHPRRPGAGGAVRRRARRAAAVPSAARPRRGSSRCRARVARVADQS